MSEHSAEGPIPVRRKRYSRAFKQQLVQETFQPGISIARVARKHGINANMLSNWRRLFDKTQALAGACTPTVLPILIQDPPAVAEATPSAQLLAIDFAKARLTIHGCPDPQTLRLVLQVLATC
jgi:transposase